MNSIEKTITTLAVIAIAIMGTAFIASHTISLTEQVTGEIQSVQGGSWEGSGIGGR